MAGAPDSESTEKSTNQFCAQKLFVLNKTLDCINCAIAFSNSIRSLIKSQSIIYHLISNWTTSGDIFLNMFFVAISRTASHWNIHKIVIRRWLFHEKWKMLYLKFNWIAFCEFMKRFERTENKIQMMNWCDFVVCFATYLVSRGHSLELFEFGGANIHGRNL